MSKSTSSCGLEITQAHPDDTGTWDCHVIGDDGTTSGPIQKKGYVILVANVFMQTGYHCPITALANSMLFSLLVHNMYYCGSKCGFNMDEYWIFSFWKIDL